MKRLSQERARLMKTALSLAVAGAMGTAHAYKFETSSDWEVNLDNSVQYTAGWRMQPIDTRISNHPFFAQGDLKFKKGEMVTNRVQDLIEFQGVYQQRMGFRTSASVWHDFAYNDNVHQNPALAATAGLLGIPACSYNNCQYSDYVQKYYQHGGEILDAFVFLNTEIGGTPVYLKAGRLSQYWGNAFFFGFTNIAYSQQPVDFIKGFSQPGSEVKELFLPRKQILVSADITPELSVTGQYFFEFRPNRYPDAGTYFGFFDILYNGPDNAGFLAASGVGGNDGMREPPNNNQNWGVKVNWSPAWLGGDLGFYYRQFDEVDPWILINPTTGHLNETFAQKVKLWGVSFEKSFGLYSIGFELNQRRGAALNSALAASEEGAKGNITNFDINAMVQLGTTPLWDSGILLMEIAGTRLNKVTGNEALYNSVGSAICGDGVGGAGTWRDGCSTKNWLGFAMLFDPQWLQVWPGIDLDMPLSYTTGIHGNSPIRASGFYAEQTNIFSIGIKATYQSKSSLSLTYNGYNWRTNKTDVPGKGGGTMYAGFGGAGPVSINDRGWLQLQFKTSF